MLTPGATASNILDVPNFFWDSEPTLHPLYAAVREYLEIDPRIKVVNERCRVFLDLAEILSDSIADSKMSVITWIIIILIGVSICVTVAEVVLRFAMLSAGGPKPPDAATLVEEVESGGGGGGGLLMSPAAPLLLDASRGEDDGTVGLSDLEILARELGLQGNASLDDVKRGIWDLKAAQRP